MRKKPLDQALELVTSKFEVRTGFPSFLSFHCLAFIVLLALGANSSATTYFVDSGTLGNDLNSGTSSNSPWKTLSKVNSTTFTAGDSILFRAGGVWTGTTQLHPLGSGAANNPIVIDMYGSGAKPIINATTATGNGAVYLSNQSYWEINNLEISSSAGNMGDRRGVYWVANTGTINHLYLRNCYIHDIAGTFSTSDGGSTSGPKRTGGMVVEDTGSSNFNDLLIENNEIYSVTNIGLVACLNANSARNVIIRGNTIHNVSKNAMIIRICDNTCLIEHNLCYDTANKTTGNTMFTADANGVVFQYNEGYNNLAGDPGGVGDHDGSLYDADLRSQNVVFQYSYSHDNAHGLFWQYSNGPDTNIIVRYNISQNDRGNIFSVNGGTSSACFYNNTIYMNASLANPNFNYVFDERSSSGHTSYFYNNIFYNLQGKAWSMDSGNTHVFDYNVYYGIHTTGEPGTIAAPPDPHRQITDPKLVAPGTAGTNDWSSFGGYKLQAGSPCIDSGTNLANNGGLDFFSNSVPYNVITDRGANEYTPSGGTPPTISCPGNITSNAAAGLCSAVVVFSVTGGGSPSPTITCSPSSGSSFTNGTTTVNCTASNGVLPNANCSFTVTVNDTQAPSIIGCAPPQTNAANLSCQASVPNFAGSVVATDNCTSANALVITQSPMAGTVVGVGTTNVTITVKDAANNPATCQTSFTVIDITPPSISVCPATQTNSADGNCQAAVPNFAGGVVATDNCTASNLLVVTQSPLLGTLVGIGTTTVTLTVKDVANNQSTCQTSFTVSDTTLPTIVCPATVVAAENPQGSGSAPVNYLTPAVGDNCSGVGTPTCSPPPGSSFAVGTNAIACVVIDNAGNTNSCVFGVVVRPASNPAFRILSLQTQNDDVNVIWATPGGTTNRVQATNGSADGAYTDSFVDISSPIIVAPVGDTTTNFVDVGGATNRPSRYYRVRVAP
jgi:hypothetical protein